MRHLDDIQCGMTCIMRNMHGVHRRLSENACVLQVGNRGGISLGRSRICIEDSAGMQQARAKSQRQIELATNLPQPTVSKLMPKMIDREWLERSERDPATSVKQVQITFRGTGVLLAFEQACRKAAKTVSKSTLSNR